MATASSTLHDYFSVNARGFLVYHQAVIFRSPPKWKRLHRGWKARAQVECRDLVKDLHASCPEWLAQARKQILPAEIPREVQIRVWQHQIDRAAQREASWYSKEIGNDDRPSSSLTSTCRPLACRCGRMCTRIDNEGA
jgi:hypothetical protein